MSQKKKSTKIAAVPKKKATRRPTQLEAFASRRLPPAVKKILNVLGTIAVVERTGASNTSLPGPRSGRAAGTARTSATTTANARPA
ncbi:MAG: hypothetical protein JWO36_5083 [Myxococcales bacterium]|nr:hypothetical protein [Myxococcales bacterium]